MGLSPEVSKGSRICVPAYPDSRHLQCLFCGCHPRIFVKSCLMLQSSFLSCRGIKGRVLHIKLDWGNEAITQVQRAGEDGSWLEDRRAHLHLVSVSPRAAWPPPPHVEIHHPWPIAKM